MAATTEGYAHHAFVTSAAAAETGSVPAAPLMAFLCPECQVVPFGQTAQTALEALNVGGDGGHGPRPADDGWEVSWQAGGVDDAGHYMAGTELMQLVAHNGSLFGGTSVRKDSPGKDPVTGAEILRLDSPTGQWQVDHEFSGLLDDGTPRYLRVSVMSEFTFTTDGTGKPLPKPVTLLLASPYDLTGPGVVFSRDDATGTWTEMVLVQNPPPSEIRALGFHHDPLTGVDYVFAASALTGTFRGVYDSAAPGGIHWDPMPELVRLRRTMAFAEANGAFHQISKPAILRRVDGPKPSWDEVYTYNPPPLSFGLRGLTTIDNPIGPGQVLLAGLEGDPAYVVRFHPNLNYRQIIELNLQDFLQRQWGALDAQFVSLAINDIPEVIDPRNGEAVRLISMDAHNPNKGYQESSWYLIRHADRQFDLREIRPLPNPRDPHPKLEATRTVVVSPFPADQGRFLYFGGYDPTRDDTAHDTAWIYRATVEAALG